ncbi:hypothetical protein [Daejeonella sp.]|uniref:hypothetical protein n=1 Tax=Daejeonella sp. TaxID=2805397 RepID=UPI0030C2DF61
MKTLTKMLLVANLLTSTSVFAQSETYQSAMKKGLELLSIAKTSESFVGTANHFERIAMAESQNWMPLYYSAYANLVAGLVSEDPNQKDQYFDKALSQIERATVMSPDNSEIYTVKGYAQFMKMSVDPQSRFALIGDSNASLGKAKQLDPQNPRPYFVQGQNTFYTPEAFGGGKSAAKKLLEEAVKKYDTYKAIADLAPSWGNERAKMLLAQCQ